MKNIRLLLAAIVFLFACKDGGAGEQNSELIIDSIKQEVTYAQLVELAGKWAEAGSANDSAAFLILPVLSSCPSCRTKAIKSIVKYQHKLSKSRLVVLSGKTSRKMMSSYFRDENAEIPAVHELILDTVDHAGSYNLYDKKPTIYYTAGKRVYRKVGLFPSTIKRDMIDYFETVKK